MATGSRPSRFGKWQGVCSLVGLISVSLCAACGGLSGDSSPTQASMDAIRAYKSAQMVHMEGQVKQVDTVYTVNLSEDGDDVDGAVIVKDAPVLVQKAGGKLFFRSDKYFASQGAVTATRWVLASGDLLTDLVKKLIDRSELAQALLAASGSNVQRKAGPVIQGQKSDELAGSALSVFVPSSGKGRPLRFQMVSGRELQDHLLDLKLDLSYDKPVHVEVPPKYVDLNDRNTLPVQFVVVPDTFAFESCDSRGCTLSTQVRNTGGRDGLATATFRVRQNGSAVASCTTDITVVGSGQSTKVGCRANYDQRFDSTANVTVNNLLP